MLNIAVLVSGGGTNLQAIIDATESGEIKDAKVSLIISSNSKAYALERGKKHGIRTEVVGKENCLNQGEVTEMILKILTEENPDLIVLAGYMTVLDEKVIKVFENRIINIHPSLIPKHCGKGFYGMKVHEAVISAGEKESGATVHLVDAGVDTGKILLQEKVVVEHGETPESLAEKVLNVEHKILVEVISEFEKSHRKSH